MKKKIVSIVGARPQFIKLAPLSKAVHGKFRHIIIHTGQHYDYLMSRVFFQNLFIPKPGFNLEIGSGGHGEQTGKMMIALEILVAKIKPDMIIVYGDTNSTLAGALTAAKLQIPLAHIEAGMRSYNRTMPEEINRVTTDHLANLHFCSTKVPAQNLRHEGIVDGIHVVGDIMIDTLRSVKYLTAYSKIINGLNLLKGSYGVLTIHRVSNTDNKNNLLTLIRNISSANFPIVFPVHPRTKKMLVKFGLTKLINTGNIKITDPLNYEGMINLVRNSKVLLTDSGGLQKEAYFLRVPCITLRNETEWVETVQEGWNRLVGTDSIKIHAAMRNIKKPSLNKHSYGRGHAATAIIKVIERYLSQT